MCEAERVFQVLTSWLWLFERVMTIQSGLWTLHDGTVPISQSDVPAYLGAYKVQGALGNSRPCPGF